MATTYKFKAYYKKNGVGAVQSPAPVCTVINMADDSKVADAQATVASTNMPGLYSYSYTGNDGLDLVAYFHTTDADADEADVASYVNDKITTNLNADVSGIPDAILTKAIVDTLTVEQVLKVLAAVETGITTGGGTDTITYTGKDGTEIRLTGVDENGNRTAVIVTPGA